MGWTCPECSRVDSDIDCCIRSEAYARGRAEGIEEGKRQATFEADDVDVARRNFYYTRGIEQAAKWFHEEGYGAEATMRDALLPTPSPPAGAAGEYVVCNCDGSALRMPGCPMHGAVRVVATPPREGGTACPHGYDRRAACPDCGGPYAKGRP